MRGLAIAALCVGCIACAPGGGSLQLPAIDGRVVDDRSGAGIAGAEVIEWFKGSAGGADVQPVVHARWTTTDARGEFRFAAGKASSGFRLGRVYGPTYSFYHPDYGLVRGGGPRDGRVVLQGSLARAELAKAELRPYCSGELDDPGSRRIAEVACPPRTPRR